MRFALLVLVALGLALPAAAAPTFCDTQPSFTNGGTVTGNQTITGSLGVDGGSTLRNGVTASGGVTADSLVVTGAAAVDGGATVANGLTSTGDTTTKGVVELRGAAAPWARSALSPGALVLNVGAATSLALYFYTGANENISLHATHAGGLLFDTNYGEAGAANLGNIDRSGIITLFEFLGTYGSFSSTYTNALRARDGTAVGSADPFFISTQALPVCGVVTEGQMVQDAAGGLSTGHRTRYCLCTSDGAGSPVYKWQNIVTATLGNTTTCQD